MQTHSYLPNIKDIDIKELLENPEYKEVLEKINSLNCERIGLDRFFTIAIDIYKNYFSLEGFKILDVGCNNGLFCLAFSQLNNYALGIDNSALDVQNVYDKLSFLETDNSKILEFKEQDVKEFLETSQEEFDFVLLLSVAHQWEFGYAHTGENSKSKEEIKWILDNIVKRTKKAIYYECPVSEPGFEDNYGKMFFERYVNNLEELKLTKIADTIATNGYTRELYRIEKSNCKKNSKNESGNYELIKKFKEDNNINGKIVVNGQTEKTKYCIIDKDYLYIPIEGMLRTAIHPLGVQSNTITHTKMWSILRDNKCPNIMDIHEIIDEIAKVSIVEGVPLLLINTAPEWQKERMLIKNLDKIVSEYSFDRAKKWMEGLSHGLAHIHKLGLAHGDTYPFNSIVTVDDNAVWIDFGNISDDISQIYKDIYVFLFFNILFVLVNCDGYSESLIDEIIFEAVKNDDVSNICENWARIFAMDREDVIYDYDYFKKNELIRAKLSENRLFSSSENHKKYFSEFTVSSTLHYYNEFLAWYSNADYLNIMNKINELNNITTASESRRLMMPKGEFYSKIDQKDQEIKKLIHEKEQEINKLIHEKEQEINNLKNYYTEKLNDVNNQIINVKNQVNIQLNNIEENLKNINKSRSYKLCKFARILFNDIKSISDILKFVKNLVKYVCGAKDSMYVYAQKDYVINLIKYVEDIKFIENNYNVNELKLDINVDRKEVRKRNCEEKSIFEEVQNLPKNIRYYSTNSNVRKIKRVAYFTNQLLDWFDQRPRYGGGERYCLNLAQLLVDHGFEVDIYQIAPTKFEGDYHGFHVKTIVHGNFFSEFNIDGANEFYNISLDYDYVLYNMPELSAMKMRDDAISICHGIWFDHNNYGASYKFRTNEWFKYLFRAFDNPRKIVSVDSNSVNVIRSFWPNLAPKMDFIPNFVDNTKFYPPKNERRNEKLKILFPRRSQINRGSRLLGDILKFVKHDVEFYWVGEGDDQDTQIILNLCNKDSRLHYEKASFDEMPELYRRSDIVVIPTIACEGTSLSCIEAIASGCATISTNVGGLTDIIQDGINGRLVNPNAKDIARAINEMIENPKLMIKYQKSGYESAGNFYLEKWRDRWENIFKEQGWIKDSHVSNMKKLGDMNICIVTKNAYHGGVESLIKLESENLNANVIVAGGLNDPDKTCPFKYEYIDCYQKLVRELKNYDVILYHWVYDWAVKAIEDSGIPSVEFVHRTDTSECDKFVPTQIVSHSQYVCDFIKQEFKRECNLVPNVVDVDYFIPAQKEKDKKVIGAVTSYYKTKGIDIFIEAWSKIRYKYPDYKVKLYGSGAELELFKELDSSLGTNIEFNGPVKSSLEVFNEIDFMVSASRIEGLPIVLLEALACNVPIIASDIDGHRIINKLAEEKGHVAPLILFESENSTELANTIDEFLQNPFKRNIREVAIDVFSPNRHIEGLKRYLTQAYNEKERKQSKEYRLVKATLNDGKPIFSNEGFIGYNAVEGTNWSNDSFSNIDIEYNNFIIYHYDICEQKISRINTYINLDVVTNCSVYVQYNWYDCNDNLVSMEGNGYYVGEKSNTICCVKDVPVNGDKITNVDIIIRPNQNETVKLNYISLDALCEKDLVE